MPVEEAAPKTPPPKANPIASGQAFIGLCNTRGVALQLFNQRVFQILAGDAAGFTALTATLTAKPRWEVLLALSITAAGIAFLHVFAVQVIKGSADRVDLWTSKLIQLEERNGVDGGVNIFSSTDYDDLRKVPAFPVKYLQVIVMACMVIWAVMCLIALTMLLKKTGVYPWTTLTHWAHWLLSELSSLWASFSAEVGARLQSLRT